MHHVTKTVISKVLEGRHFNVAVDLGCGHGDAGDVLKHHCNFLIGVDRSIGRLAVAKEFGGYDKIVCSDIKEYKLPPDTEALFMFNSLEHIPLTDGVELLKRSNWVPFTLLTTDTKFALSLTNHWALWSEKLLRNLRFKTTTYRRDLISDTFWGKQLIALR